jgi:hypothetical protein
MNTALIPAPSPSLATMTLADAPDYLTAIAAGEAHGLTPPDALKSAFGKWLSENAGAVERFGLANFYEGTEESKAFANYSALVRLLTLMVAEQGREIAALKAARIEARV